MDYQQVYPDDSSYQSSKEGDHAHDSPNYYSDSNDSYDNSFSDSDIVNWMMMMHITLMTREYLYKIFIDNIYSKYARYFDDGNILEAEKDLHHIKYNSRKPTITPGNILTYNIYVIL